MFPQVKNKNIPKKSINDSVQAADLIINLLLGHPVYYIIIYLLIKIYLFIKDNPGFQHCGTSGTGWLKTGEAHNI